MKRILAMLVVLVFAAMPVLAEETDVPNFDLDKLVVGSTTALTGSFFTDQWGNNTSDLDARLLLHGYSLVTWDPELGGYDIDENVVNGFAAVERESGERVFHLALQRDLTYCDGTPITAADYALSILLSMAPEIAEIGGQTSGTAYIAGSDAYREGETKVLSGVRMLNEYQLSITVKAEYFPYFYELALLNFRPYPVNVLIPGCQVADDGEGVYIKGAAFNAELLKKTILDPVSGYQVRPMVTSGPYMLVEYRNNEAEFAINPYFKGTRSGAVPTIQHIYFRPAENENMIALLQAGEFDLLNKCVNKDTLTQGMQLIADPNYGMRNYARTGLSLISFCCEKPVLNSENVRKAIACCFDKDQFISDIEGNFGLRTDGYYGLGQWMYLILNGTIESADLVEPEETATDEEKKVYEEKKAAWESLNLDNMTVYPFDVEEAVKLLEEDGWTLNENGEAFLQETDNVRCKNVDGNLEKLALTLAYPEGNAAGEVFLTTLAEHLEAAGITLEIKPVPMDELQKMYYRQTDRNCDMIYLAVNFSGVFDPEGSFALDMEGFETANATAIQDEELATLAQSLRETEPGDTLTYVQKWIAFQERFTDLLPAIPVYSNVYFDFMTAHLQNYEIQNFSSWAEAIVESRMAEIVIEEAETEEEFTEFEEEF